MTLTKQEVAALPDGTILRGEYTIYSSLNPVIKYGTLHKKRTAINPNNIYAFWETSIAEAIKVRDDALACSNCKGSGQYVKGCKHRATWINRSNISLPTPTSSNNSGTTSSTNIIADDCHCPMLRGGGIDHDLTCNYLLSKASASPI